MQQSIAQGASDQGVGFLLSTFKKGQRTRIDLDVEGTGVRLSLFRLSLSCLHGVVCASQCVFDEDTGINGGRLCSDESSVAWNFIL